MDLQLAALSQGLERHFRQIQRTRMAGVPILNPALRVQAVGFRRTGEDCLGVLVTPWFISLVALPCEGDDWQDLAVGTRRTRVFPSGAYDFLVAEESAIGRYQTCPLLSPVLELADQETAIAFAEAALRLIRDPGQRDLESATHAAEIERRWHAEEPTPAADAPRPPAGAEPDPLAERRISRRDLLRGRFAGRENRAERNE